MIRFNRPRPVNPGTASAVKAVPLAGLLLLFAFQPVLAQGDPGFLFGAPNASLTLKVGYAIPRADSELFDFTREQLTVDKDDFNGVSIAGELGVRLSERADFTVGLGFTGSNTRSEFREWVDENDLPIQQETTFNTVPLSVGVKAYLFERGRSVGRLAWIPGAGVNPYVGVAVGPTWYRFEQFGEFIDFETLEIFPDNIYSDGVAFSGHVISGFDVNVSSRVYFTGEARYGWGSATLDDEFVGFDDLDLAGFQASGGIGFRF